MSFIPLYWFFHSKLSANHIIISNHIGLFNCIMNLCLQPFDEHQWQYFAEKTGVSTGMLGSPDS